LNGHPFQAGRFLWLHNGRIHGFQRIKRRLCDHLDDAEYDAIQGTTDSEHAFALFLHELGSAEDEYEAEQLLDAMRRMVRIIERWLEDADPDAPSRLNFAVTDGHNLVATRYVTGDGARPESLYVAQGERLEVHDGKYRMGSSGSGKGSVIVASEPLTEVQDDWHAVPVNHAVTVTPDLEVAIGPVG
jgi:glutamine amidotransferase